MNHQDRERADQEIAALETDLEKAKAEGNADRERFIQDLIDKAKAQRRRSERLERVCPSIKAGS